MPVDPPYGIIDTIARLRAQGGEAWGRAASDIGKDIGGVGQAYGKGKMAQAERTTSGAQDFRSNFDPSGAPGSGGPGILGGGPQGTSVTPGLDAASKLAPLDHETGHKAALAFDQAHDGIQHLTTAPQGGGAVNMAVWMKQQGLQPAKGMENIWGTPKMTSREQSQAATTREEMRLKEQENVASERDAAIREGKTMKLDAKTAKGYKMPNGEPLPAGEYPTAYINSLNASDAKKVTAKTGADAKKSVKELDATTRMNVEHFKADLAKEKIGTDAYNKKIKEISDYGTKHEIAASLFGIPSYIGAGENDKPKGKAAPAKDVASNDGPLGATTVKNGKTYVWSPETQKYHLAQ